MRFKTDENLPSDVAELLNQHGHNAESVWQEKLSGTPDENLASVCQKEQRALLTLDTDFADIRTYPPQNYPGIIVFRLVKQDKLYVLSIVTRVIELLKTEALEKRLWIVDEKRVRIREGQTESLESEA
jgi:predicted nuclease of predicted toxin-antitoxin system